METAHLNPAGESISIYSQPTSCNINQELRAVLKMLQIEEGSNSSCYGQREGHCDTRSRKSILITLKNKKNAVLKKVKSSSF